MPSSRTISYRLSNSEYATLEKLGGEKHCSVHEAAKLLVQERLGTVKAVLGDSEAIARRSYDQGVADATAGFNSVLYGPEIQKLVQAQLESPALVELALSKVPVDCVMCDKPVGIDIRKGTSLRKEIEGVLAGYAFHEGGCRMSLMEVAGTMGRTETEQARAIFQRRQRYRDGGYERMDTVWKLFHPG